MKLIRWEFAILPPSPASAPRRDERALIFPSQFLIIHLLSTESFFLVLAQGGWTLMGTSPANGDQCHSFTSLKDPQPGLNYKKPSSLNP